MLLVLDIDFVKFECALFLSTKSAIVFEALIRALFDHFELIQVQLGVCFLVRLLRERIISRRLKQAIVEVWHC